MTLSQGINVNIYRQHHDKAIGVTVLQISMFFVVLT